MHIRIRFTRDEMRLLMKAQPRGGYFSRALKDQPTGDVTLDLSLARVQALIPALRRIREHQMAAWLQVAMDTALSRETQWRWNRALNGWTYRFMDQPERWLVQTVQPHPRETPPAQERGTKGERKPNPVPASRLLKAGGSRARDAATRLYEDFSGNRSTRRHRVAIPDYDTYLQVGKIDAILYTTHREGRVEHYRHDFTRTSRPLLIASHDGKELRMIGGSFAFTDRGIVDHDAEGRPLE